MPGWFYGDERIPAQLQGLFYVPSLKRFVTEDGTILPLTFERPTEIFTPSDQPWAVVHLTPFDFPTKESVASVTSIIKTNMRTLSPLVELSIEYLEDPKGRDYLQFTSPTREGKSEQASIGRLARQIMCNGVATAIVELRAQLVQAGVV
jgi:hypothetical protein